MKLSTPVLVDAVLIMGENTLSRHLSEFYIFVGFSPDHNSNTACPGAPFAYPIDTNYATYHNGGPGDKGSEWSNGVEAWCGLAGNHVSFVRKADASPPLDEIVLCTFGVVSNGIEVEIYVIPSRFNPQIN